MSQFTPAMKAALAAERALLFGALKIQLPNHTVRLLDGSGEVPFGGDTYTGRDPIFGVLAAIDTLTDGVGDEAPALSITLLPASDAAAATLASASMQGSPVTLSLGALDPMTGAVIPDPMLLFLGELDQPRLSKDGGKRELEYECVSSFERLFDNDEGARLSDSYHQSIWPGEKGMSNVTGIIKTIYWGVESPRGSISYGGGGGGGGGMSGNNGTDRPHAH
jgi:hypothetical protein